MSETDAERIEREKQAEKREMFAGYFLMTRRNPIIYTGHIHV